METNKILEADYLDLIFDNRNKKYGSYELRKNYKRRTTKALVLVLAAVLLSVATPFAYGKIFPGEGNLANLPVRAHDTVVTVLDKVIFEEKKIIPPTSTEKTQSKTPSIAKTAEFTEPKIVKDNMVDKPLTKTNFDDDAIAGLATNPGNGGVDAAKNSEVPKGPPGGGSTKPEEETLITNEPVNIVDVLPEYPGGLKALMSYLSQNITYPTDARENDIQGRVVIKFVVNEFGRVEQAKVVKSLLPSCDREALRVVNAMKAWKPGQVKGKAVKSYYTLPITFRLQQ